MDKKNIYTVGGTVQAGGGIYIERQADEELLRLCLEGAFSYVLTSRQLGKSSLMVRTAQKLQEQNIKSVIIDLNELGVIVSEEEWYLGLLTTISEELLITTNVIQWWREHDDFGATQRLIKFIEQVLLVEVTEPIVIFIDEIDSTLSLDFTDDFFAAIRFMFDARARTPILKRLTFVLIGVATPGDLISSPHRTPFNIGTHINLDDFTEKEAEPFAEGFDKPPAEEKKILKWILKWTNGHPYLTQRLCRTITDQYRKHWTEPQVDALVRTTFLGRKSEEDNNLQFVRDMLIRRTPDVFRVLSIYKDIRTERNPVRDDEQSTLKTHLKLSGIVKRENGNLVLRNPIYAQVFDLAWIKDHWPVSWYQSIPKGIKIASAIILVLLVATSLTLFRSVRIAKAKVIAEERAKVAAQREAQIRDREAQTQRELAEKAADLNDTNEKRALEAEAYAAKERNLRMAAVVQRRIAEDERTRAEEERRKSDSLRVEQEKARKLAEDRAATIRQNRYKDLARNLASEAMVQAEIGSKVKAMLLARQAFLFNEQYDGLWDNQIYWSLISTLGGAGGPIALRGHTAAVRAVAFEPNGGQLLSGGDDGTVCQWSINPQDSVPKILRDHNGYVRTLLFDRNNSLLFSGGDDKSVRLWSHSRKSWKSSKLANQDARVWALAVSNDGKILATGGADSIITVWELGNQSKPLLKIKHDAWIRALVFSPNDQYLVSGCENGSIKIMTLDNGKSQLRGRLHHAKGVKSLVISPDGQNILSGGNDGRVIIWDISLGAKKARQRRQFLAHSAPVSALAFSPDGQLLASGSTDKTAKIWNVAQKKNEPNIIYYHADFVWSVAFNSDGTLLASGCADKVVRVWDTRARILADKVCELVGDDSQLTPEEWEQFVGSDITYEETCEISP